MTDIAEAKDVETTDDEQTRRSSHCYPIVAHRTMIHAICPHGGWDYYEVEYQPTAFMTTEDFQDACDAVRGTEAYQEAIAERLASYLMDGELTVTGRHGSNTETVCKMEIKT